MTICVHIYIYIYRDCNASVMHFVKESGIIAVRAIQRLLWVSPCQPTRHVQNVRSWDESFSLNRLCRDRNLWQFLFGVSCGWWWFCGPAVEWIFHVASGWIIHSKKFPFTLCLALHHLCCCRWTSPNIGRFDVYVLQTSSNLQTTFIWLCIMKGVTGFDFSTKPCHN